MIEEAKVKALQIAPFKSGDTIPLLEARMTMAGMETVDGQVKDHEYFAVRRNPDSSGIHEFVTQRHHKDPGIPGSKPESFQKLALIKPEIGDEGQLVLSWDYSNRIDAPEEWDPNNELPVRLWDYEGKAIEVPELSEWLADNSGYDLRVVRTVGPWDRMARKNYLWNNNPLRAQDGYPVHAILWEDVSAISKHPGQDVPWKRFRPQILLEGALAWSLHEVFAGQIEEAVVFQPKPCDRCDVPRIDQETGELSPVKPLVLIDEVRPKWINKDEKPKTIFGENWLPQGETIVRIGSSFRTITARDPLKFKQ